MAAQVFEKALVNLSSAYTHSSVVYREDSWAKSSVFSKQNVIDDLIPHGFANEQAVDRIMFTSQNPREVWIKGDKCMVLIVAGEDKLRSMLK